MTWVKCDYREARWAILSQISILVGIMQQAVRWACDGEAERTHALAALRGDGLSPTNPRLPKPPHDWEWEFYVDQLRVVVGWIPDLEVRCREWIGQPLRVTRSQQNVTPCIPIGTPPP